MICAQGGGFIDDGWHLALTEPILTKWTMALKDTSQLGGWD